MNISQIRRELVRRRSEAVGGHAHHVDPRRLRDAFMEDYQMITAKASNANQMSIHLGKQVLFDVGTLSYFDRDANGKQDRIVVNRTCHYSDPELQRQFQANEFETLLKSMTYYHELANADGEHVAAETLDDDPFIPEQTETLLGEARLKLSGRKIPSEIIKLPITTAFGDSIGELSVEVTFKLLSKNETNCYDMKQMENKSVAVIIGFEGIRTQMELPYIKFTFCGVGTDIVTISNREEELDEMDMEHDDEKVDLGMVKSTEHTFEDSYKIPSIQVTPAFKNFLSAPGILFKIWAGSLKRKIEFRTEIGDYQQQLFYHGAEMENERTLLDYEVSDGDTITIKIIGANTDSDTLNSENAKDPKQFFMKRTSLLDLEPDDIEKELVNPALSKEERGRIRRIKNKSIHMAFIKEDLENQPAMTLESYQQENQKLREELMRANHRIEQLERELATVKSKGSGASKSRVFGSWRRKGKGSGSVSPKSPSTPGTPGTPVSPE